MFKKLMMGLLSSCVLTACQNATPLSLSPIPQQQLQANSYDPQYQDTYLCAVEHREKQSIVKSMDLQTHQMRSTFVPGKVHGLAGDPDTRTLYIHAQEGAYHSLYAVDVKSNSIKREAMFNQVGLIPEDFVITKGMLYVVGHQKNGTALMRMDLRTKQWMPVVYGVKPGDLEANLSNNDLQVLNFSDESLTKTTINVSMGQKKEVYFDFSQKDRHEKKLNGVISQSGNYIYANFSDKIGRYRVQANKLVRLNPIPMNTTQARYVALSRNEGTLYVTTEQSNQVLQVHMSPNGENFKVRPLSFPGDNHELVAF